MPLSTDLVKYLPILSAIAALLNLRDSAVVGELKTAVNDLVAKLTPQLPAKPDGTPWTDEDVHLAAAQAAAPWQSVKDETGGAA